MAVGDRSNLCAASDPAHVPSCRPPRLGQDFGKALRPVYTAPTEAAAQERFTEFSVDWAAKYPGIIRLWESAWAEFVPFLAFELEVRRVIFSTNAIESLNARFRRAVRARGHFPNEQAAIKCLYLALRSLDPTGRGRQRWAVRWKPALNAFALMFEGRIFPMSTTLENWSVATSQNAQFSNVADTQQQMTDPDPVTPKFRQSPWREMNPVWVRDEACLGTKSSTGLRWGAQRCGYGRQNHGLRR